MTSKERFKQICRFERHNDPFIWSVASWYETIELWLREGIPVKNLDNMKEVNLHLLGLQDQNEAIQPKGAIFGMGKNNNPPWVVAIDPIFEPKILEDEGEYVVQVDYDGSIVRRGKEHDDSIPQTLEYPVKDRKSWQEYKKRLDPFSPGRWPKSWEIMTDDKLDFPIKKKHDGKHWKERDFPLGMNLLSLYGNLRTTWDWII